MSITRNSLKRPAALFAAAALLVGAAAPSFMAANTAFAAQVTSRSIRISDATPSGTGVTTTPGTGTAVKYKLTFTTAQAAWQSAVVDFCAASPLINDSCTAPTGFSSASATLTANGTWSLAASTSQWKLTNTAAQGAGTPVFEINGVTNPSTLGSFYARVTLYANDTYGTYVDATNTGNYLDYGGIALSTTRLITVTARVMERLSLCTSGGVAGTNANNLTAADSCASATVPSITLGSAPDYVLGYLGATPSTANIYTQLSTNAANGYALYLRGSNSACASNQGGLSRDGGSTCEIAPINTGTATSDTFTDNTAEFGAHVSAGVAATGGTGTNTAVARWAGPNWLMDTTSANDNVVDTYGSKIAFTDTGDPKQANSVNNTITFGAVASPVTPAGIYSQNFSLIGVGTF